MTPLDFDAIHLVRRGERKRRKKVRIQRADRRTLYRRDDTIPGIYGNGRVWVTVTQKQHINCIFSSFLPSFLSFFLLICCFCPGATVFIKFFIKFKNHLHLTRAKLKDLNFQIQFSRGTNIFRNTIQNISQGVEVMQRKCHKRQRELSKRIF